MTPKTVTKIVSVNPSEGITLTYDTSDALFHVGAYATITHIEVIEEGCDSGCEAGGGNLDNGSIHVALNLGRTDLGQSAGALRIQEQQPSVVLGTPASLRYASAWQGVQVIRNGTDVRQVRAPQCLADVVTETADRFRVDFYDSVNMGPFSGGIYDQAGKSPYVSWVIENVDTANNDHLRVTQVKGAVSVVNEFIWDPVAQGWELQEGDGQRKEKKTVVIDAVAQTRTVTTVVRNATDQLVSKEVNVYKDFPWGRELLSTVVDPDGAALTSTRVYYDNAVTDGGAYGKLKSVTRSDGGWARHEYDTEGRLTKMVEPFLDAAVGAAESACKVTTLAYSEFAPQETRVVTILGQEVERTYKANSGDFNHTSTEIVCTVPGATHTAASNLVTVTQLVNQGPFTGEIQSVIGPDGTSTRYEYSQDSPTAPTQKTTIVTEGALSGGSIVDGTATTTITDVAGNLISEMVVDVASGLTLSLKTVTSTDPFGRPTVIDYNDGTSEIIAYGCCGVASRTGRDGIATTYTYDSFKRVFTETRAGITMAYTYDAEGRVLTRSRIGSDSSVIIQETNTYDVAGRRNSTKDALENITTTTWSTDASGRPVETVNYPDGGTSITVRHKDGRLYDISGTAPARKRWTYGFSAGIGYFEREVNVTATGSLLEGTIAWQDVAGRVIRTQQTGRTIATRHYNAVGRLERTVDPDGVVTLYTYDGLGNLATRVLDTDRDGIPSAADRIESTTRQVVAAHGTIVRRTEQRVFNATGVEELASQSDVSADGRSQWVTRWGRTSSSSVTFGAGGTRTEIQTRPDGSTVTRSYDQGRLVQETVAGNGGSPLLSSRTYAYDPHGRVETVTDARNGATTSTYDARDRVLSVTTPAPGLGLAAQTTYFAYDAMGRNTVTTLPDSSQTTNEWFVTGRLKKQSGSQVPTVEYTYDTQGRMKTMVTTGQAGPATTTWNYQTTTGWLIQKIYPDGDTISYTYTQAGRLLTRNTGRGVSRTYAYDLGGRHTGVNYSDATPDVTYSLNRLGQIIGILDGSGTRTRSVATDGRLLSESYSDGLLAGASLTYGHDALLRRQTFSAFAGGLTSEVTWGYDAASRLATVASSEGTTSSYYYEAASSLIVAMDTAQGGNARVATASTYDALNRLTSISTGAGFATTGVSSHTYTYNDLNQRTESVLEDGERWDYQYDPMGQVISGQKKDAAGQPVPGTQFGYAFDGIGNRTSATVNGRTGTYTADAANQYTQRQVPGAVDIRGSASPAAKVTVNGQNTQRLGDSFYKALTVDNSAAPQYPGVSVLAVRQAAGPNGEDVKSETLGNLFLAKTPEVFTHDAEGNLSADGRWIYTWDGENRLIRMETLAAVPVAAKRKLDFAYDAHSRRIRKQVSTWNGSNWDLQSDRRYLYDGWNLVAELDAANTMLRTYTWGLDLSRSPQGAGGVGGLLAIHEGGESYLPAYDGNGNVTALVKASDYTIAARYEYGPFGETLVAQESGISNPFRFSTKFQDGESGLYYYGYRFYDPVSGRWPSRDPIEERGGVNIYGFVRNYAVGRIDRLGLDQLEGGVAGGGQIMIPLVGAIAIGVDVSVAQSIVFETGWPPRLMKCWTVTLTGTVGLGGGAGFSLGPMAGYSPNDTLTGSSVSTGGMASVGGVGAPIEGSLNISFDDNNPNVYLNGARGGVGGALYIGASKSFSGKDCVSGCWINPMADARAFATASKLAWDAFNGWAEGIKAEVQNLVDGNAPNSGDEQK